MSGGFIEQAVQKVRAAVRTGTRDERRAVALAALAVAVGIGLVVLWIDAPWLYASTPSGDGRAQAIAMTRTGILGVAAGLVALAGVLANLLENRRATNLTHARELYTAAVTHLGSNTLDIRLGGLYALERIATDYATDHRTVVDVLSAFIREHTIPGRPGTQRRQPTPADAQRPAAPAAIDTDIQAALTILGRLRSRDRIPRADLTGAILTGAQLRRANLTGAQLSGANLTGAQLDEANLAGADLSRANLTDAWLRMADLTSARLDEADLTTAWLVAANLTGARLDRANLTGAQLDDTNLIKGSLGRANLTDTLLHGANLTDAHLEGADLTGAHLGGANLTGAWLRGATFTSAHLNGANLTDTRLSPEQISATQGDERTRLPDGVTPPAAWMTS